LEVHVSVRIGSSRHPVSLVAVTAVALAAAACGGSSGAAAPQISIAPAKSFAIAGFAPAVALPAGSATPITFRIEEPSGQPLTAYKTGAGPHTGVHLIFVRRDLTQMVHLHPQIAPDGTIATPVTLPSTGQWRLLVDAYVNLPGQPPNFQLHRDLDVAGTGGAAAPAVPGTFQPVVKTDGYTFQVSGKPDIKSLQAGTLHVTVTGPDGKPAAFTPWFGAIAHAIFFQEGTLNYFHTHVCAPGDAACAGTSSVVGSSTRPGSLDVGVLLPGAGTWRLFLQVQVAGDHVLTAPFTLVAA
jgi:hypothetical protein